MGILADYWWIREPCACLQVYKVYIGSFNADKPVRSDLNPAGVELFEKEQSDLLQDLYDIPQRACDRKVAALPMCRPSHASKRCNYQDSNIIRVSVHELMQAFGSADVTAEL